MEKKKSCGKATTFLFFHLESTEVESENPTERIDFIIIFVIWMTWVGYSQKSGRYFFWRTSFSYVLLQKAATSWPTSELSRADSSPVWKARSCWGNDRPSLAMATMSSTSAESSGFAVPCRLFTIASDIPKSRAWRTSTTSRSARRSSPGLRSGRPGLRRARRVTSRRRRFRARVGRRRCRASTVCGWLP